MNPITRFVQQSRVSPIPEGPMADAGKPPAGVTGAHLAPQNAEAGNAEGSFGGPSVGQGAALHVEITFD